MLNRHLYSPLENHNLFLQGGIDLNMLGSAEFYYEVHLQPPAVFAGELTGSFRWTTTRAAR